VRVDHPLVTPAPKIGEDAVLPWLNGLHSLNNDVVPLLTINCSDNEPGKPHLRHAREGCVTVEDEVVPRLSIKVVGRADILLH